MFNKIFARGLLATLVMLASVAVCRADIIVNSGWDLLETCYGTNFMGVDFQGVPLGTYDFGGSIGVKDVGATDTIVQRLAQASAPNSVIDIQMDALQLRTVDQVSMFSGPVGYYYLTLQKGTASTGTMTINFYPEPSGPPPVQPDHGTFDSSFDVFFDMRFGSLDGPIVYSSDLVLTSTDNHWSHFPPEGALEIANVNFLLNGTDETNDFWPSLPGGSGVATITEAKPGLGQHVVMSTLIPEPSTLVLLGVGAFSLLGYVWRRRIAGRKIMVPFLSESPV